MDNADGKVLGAFTFAADFGNAQGIVNVIVVEKNSVPYIQTFQINNIKVLRSGDVFEV